MMQKKVPDKTASDVATWMLSEFEKQDGVLDQSDAAARITDVFGKDFTYENDGGNTCINRAVLNAFRKLTGDSVVWIRGDRLWRRREAGDKPSRQQE